MKTVSARLAVAFALALTLVATAQEAADDDGEVPERPAPTSVAQVLGGTLARFPVEPVSLSGSLIVRKQAGVLVREIPFTMTLRWGAAPATADYTIFDAFGRVLNTMAVSRAAGGAVTMAYRDGEGKDLPPPSLTAQIAGTDITWLDITLAYLWWEDGRLLEPQTFKGTLCDVVEVRPPSPLAGCACVRLWIDRKRGFMRQAEQIDADGRRVRWMWVSSVGKINDRWMIKNMEIKRPGTGLQTKLHVDDLETP